MGTVEETLNIARAEIGYKEYPAGSNKTKYGVWFGMNGQPWCAIFTCWVLHHAKVPYFKSAYTPSLADWFKGQGRWHSTPRPGDLVFFNFPGGQNRIEHVGIVESVGNGFIISIEGNTAYGNDANGGMVMRRQRSSSIVGYGRPAYSTVVSPTPTPNPPSGPIVGETKKVAEDLTMNETQISLSFDGNGNGWARIAVPHSKIIGIKFQGSYPPNDGYWPIPDWASQERDGQAVLTFRGGQPNGTLLAWVYSRP